jgi:hypothetical protein
MMGEILTFTQPPRGPHLVATATSFPAESLDATTERWQVRQLSEAMASLAIAGADVAEAQKMFHQQRTDPRTMISADTIESMVLALISTIHICGMSNRDRALYAALLHWLQGHQGGDDAA